MKGKLMGQEELKVYNNFGRVDLGAPGERGRETALTEEVISLTAEEEEGRHLTENTSTFVQAPVGRVSPCTT